MNDWLFKKMRIAIGVILVIYIHLSVVLAGEWKERVDGHTSLLPVGQWAGVGKQLDTATSWSIFVRSDGEVVSIDYHSLVCGGKLIYQRTNQEKLIFRESLNYGKEYCLNNGKVAIFKVDNDSIDYEWIDDQGQTIAKTRLSRTNNFFSNNQFVFIYDQAVKLFQIGKLDAAIPKFKKAMKILEQGLDKTDLNFPQFLYGLAHLYQSRSLYAEALNIRKQILQLYIKQGGLLQSEVAESYDKLSETYDSLGNHKKAQILRLQALDIYQKVLPPNHPAVAYALIGVAYDQLYSGKYRESEQRATRALEVIQQSLGREHYSVGSINNLLGQLHREQGQYDLALKYFQRAYDISQKQFGDMNSRSVGVQLDIALLYSLMGEYEKSIQTVQIAAWHAKDSSEYNLLWRIPYTLSRIYLQQEDFVQAIIFGKQAVNQMQVVRTRIATIEKKMQKSFLDAKAFLYTGLADMLIEQGRLPEAQQVLAMLKEEEYFDFIRRNASSDTRSTTLAFNPTERQWLVRYNKTGGRVAAIGAELRALKKKGKQMRSDMDKKRIKQLRAELKTANKAFNRTVRDLQEAFSRQKKDRHAELKSKQIDSNMRGLMRELGHDAVLLQYIMMDDKLHILLTTTDVQIARHADVKASELNIMIQNFRQALGNPGLDPRPAGKTLYAELLAPVEDDLKQAGAKMLMVSLDGALRYIPLSALYDGEHFVAERYAVAIYTEAARDRIKDKPKSDWQVAGLGLSHKVEGFNPLPAVPQELDNIVNNGLGDKVGVIPGIVHLDQAFTDESLQEVLFDEYQVLHIASHFVFKAGTLEKSFLLLGDGTHLSLAQIQQGDYDLGSVELLTLSACETAVGDSSASGNEVEGLGTLAQKKGAKGVLATLWSVADQSTGLFMQNFYKMKVESPAMTKAETLRQVQLGFITGGQQIEAHDTHRGAEPMQSLSDSSQLFIIDAKAPFAHPYYWAPFILMGNWL